MTAYLFSPSALLVSFFSITVDVCRSISKRMRIRVIGKVKQKGPDTYYYYLEELIFLFLFFFFFFGLVIVVVVVVSTTTSSLVGRKGTDSKSSQVPLDQSSTISIWIDSSKIYFIRQGQDGLNRKPNQPP